MLVPAPDGKANKGTGTEVKKKKKELVCDGDDVLEPSLKRTARQLRRKPSSCTEKLEEGTGTGKLEEGTSNTSSSSRFSNLNTTVSRTVRFSGYKTQSKECPKSTIMNISEKQNKFGDYVKAKLMGNDLKLIKESENELKRVGGRLHK